MGFFLDIFSLMLFIHMKLKRNQVYLVKLSFPCFFCTLSYTHADVRLLNSKIQKFHYFAYLCNKEARIFILFFFPLDVYCFLVPKLHSLRAGARALLCPIGNPLCESLKTDYHHLWETWTLLGLEVPTQYSLGSQPPILLFPLF